MTTVGPGELTAVQLHVNGSRLRVEVEPRWLLSDVLRNQLGLTGTHVGCEHGVCGCCTVSIDGQPARSCLTLAVSVDGSHIETVEGLSHEGEELHPLQIAFRAHHGLQCGFCTPGFLMAALPIYEDAHTLSDDALREALGGQLCRCTGYHGIVEAVREAGRLAQNGEALPVSPAASLFVGRSVHAPRTSVSSPGVPSSPTTSSRTRPTRYSSARSSRTRGSRISTWTTRSSRGGSRSLHIP